MATEPQGIMSLPPDPEMALPPGVQAPGPAPEKLSRADAYDASRQALVATHPDAAATMENSLADAADELANLPKEALRKLLGLVEYMMDNEEQYPVLRENLIKQGMFGEEDIPAEYDPEFLAVMEMVLRKALGEDDAPEEMAPPPGFATGGIADAVSQVAGKGRRGDTQLAHINRDEAKLLEALGGSGTVNPATGLREYGFFSSLFKSVKNVVKKVVDVTKKVVSSPIGKIIATVGLTALTGGLGLGALAAPVAQGAATLLGGGSLKDALVSGAIGYFGAPGGVMDKFTQPLAGALGITSNVATSALNQGLLGTAAGVLQGKGLQQAITSGLTAGAMGAAGTYMNEGYMAPKAFSGDLGATDIASNGTPPTGFATPPSAAGSAAVNSGTTSGTGIMDSALNLFKDDQGNYSPWKIGAGVVGATALLGGTKQGELQQSAMEEQLRAPVDMPDNLLRPVQNLRGVEYGQDGEFTGNAARWDPRPPFGSSVVPESSFQQFAPPTTYAPQYMSQQSAGVQQPYNTSQAYSNLRPPMPTAPGGIAQLAQGGYPRRMGHIAGPGTSTSDSIPAMLSDGEFVMTADAVRGAGDGSREDGARRMYQLMHQFEQNT